MNNNSDVLIKYADWIRETYLSSCHSDCAVVITRDSVKIVEPKESIPYMQSR